MLGIGSAIIPFTDRKGGGGGTGAVDTVSVSVSSPDGTVNQPEPSSCEVIDGKAIVRVKLTSQQGQQNAVKKITTPTGVLLPDQISGNIDLNAASLNAYTKAQSDAITTPINEKADDAAYDAQQAKDAAAIANTNAQTALTKSQQALDKCDTIVLNLNSIQGSIVSSSIRGTLVFSYANKTLILTEEVNKDTLGFVKSVAGALPDAQGDAKPTPGQLDTYSQEEIDTQFAAQEEIINQTASNLNNLTLRYNSQTGVITSPDGTVVGAMNWDQLTSKWTLSLRADEGGASTLIESDTLDIELIQGGYKINLGINPAQFDFIDKILNYIGHAGKTYQFGAGLEENTNQQTGITTVDAIPTLEIVSTLAEDTQSAVDNLQGQIDDVASVANTAIQSVNGKTGKAVTLTPADIGTYGKAYLDGQFGLVEAEISGVETQLQAVKATANSATQNILPGGSNVTVAYDDKRNATITVTNSGVDFQSDGSIKKLLIGVPKATQYQNSNPNWAVTLKEVTGLCVLPQIYVARMNIPARGNTSGGTYGVYKNYSSNPYNQLISCRLDVLTGQTTDQAIFNYIYSNLNDSSEILFNFVGTRQGDGCAIPKSVFSLCTDMASFAAQLQIRLRANTNPQLRLRANTNPQLSNGTVTWNATTFQLTFISGSTEWNFDYCGEWGGNNANNLLGLTPQKGAFLLPTGYSGMLQSITFDAHDNFANASKLSRTFTPDGNTSQFTIEIYESGTYLPDPSNWALLTYDVNTSSLMAVNQNPSYTYQQVTQWDDTLVSWNTNPKFNFLFVIEIRNKKPSPYKNLYFTPIVDGKNTISPNFIMLVPSRKYGMTDVVGQPIALNSGANHALFEDEYIAVRMLWNNPTATNPITIYSGNEPAVTITNVALTNNKANALGYKVDADTLQKYPQNPYYQTYIDTGLVDKTYANIIKSTLSSQYYDNNFVVVPAQNTIYRLGAGLSGGGTFQLYFLFGLVNYTQTFSSTVMIPFESVGTFTNCKIRVMLPNPSLFNGKPITSDSFVDVTLPTTINGGQTLFLKFEVTYIDSTMNINCAVSLQPLLSMQQFNYSDGESDLSLAKTDNGIKSVTRTHFSGENLLNLVLDDGSDPYLKTTYNVEAGNKYYVQIFGSLKFSNPLLLNNEVKIGLLNIVDNSFSSISIPINPDNSPDFDYKIATEFGYDNGNANFIFDTMNYNDTQTYRLIAVVDNLEQSTLAFENDLILTITKVL